MCLPPQSYLPLTCPPESIRRPYCFLLIAPQLKRFLYSLGFILFMPSERILITREGETFYVRDLGKDYHTKHGFVKKEILGMAKPGTKITTNTGKEFFVLEPGFTDLYRRIKRAPQIMLAKDLAVIISETGINNKSMVVDAGSGSGASACFLGNIAK